MADEGWTIEMKCPHGVTHRGPVESLRGFLPLIDKCDQAVMERAMQPKQLSRKEKRKFRRLARQLNALNAEQPPSSETKETP